MIDSLLYLYASRPDIMLSVCMCARFQANIKECHFMAVKRIMRYLVHTLTLACGILRAPISIYLGIRIPITPVVKLKEKYIEDMSIPWMVPSVLEF
jgi:hypothetical protein